ncbi:hypothetical protein C2869_04490 [Saccharobesus litoralis]|uniref:Lipoprotein n=1 Tax=Saccharobesus litoralis TaxID=2172099 RepID=A0A2S0VNE0_9ALTE|nr:hypothetical protein [Saccharobesus litoralis]AWB65741.1 hypothetical protein C2869_04490 [Saccharobesus litoralis]
MKKFIFKYVLLIASTLLLGCNESQVTATSSTATANSNQSYPATEYLKHDETYNPEAVIPPQCYTKTNGVNNPCYVCHQTYKENPSRPNVMNDGNLQGAYEFSEVGETNSWQNLFKNRTDIIAKIADQQILSYIEQDNYTPFINTLKNKQDWVGGIHHIKDLEKGAVAFDHQGVAKDNSHWVAFNYKPFPSTFWPTNGSTGDVMIRLPQAFRELNGQYQRDIYFANLALLEMVIKDLSQISVPTLNEKALGLDLNQDGQLTTIDQLKRHAYYFGDAAQIKTTTMLYPENTEFLHTVRYLGVDENGNIHIPKRMKEVRYMKKTLFREPVSLASAYYKEVKEKHFENLPITTNLGDRGIGNGFGWEIQGFIENKNGQLRQQNHEEMTFCNGCHKTVGSTIDQTFSFARKIDGVAGWGYIDLTKMQDVPNKGESQGEYLTYMQRVGGGDEFRQNQEMLAKWFNLDGTVNTQKVLAVDNLYDLIMPSKTRALKLNKAYYSIVQEQSYIFGRDATVLEASNVLTHIDGSQAPLKAEHRFQWDMRLNWQGKQHIAATQVNP